MCTVSTKPSCHWMDITLIEFITQSKGITSLWGHRISLIVSQWSLAWLQSYILTRHTCCEQHAVVHCNTILRVTLPHCNTYSNKPMFWDCIAVYSSPCYVYGCCRFHGFCDLMCLWGGRFGASPVWYAWPYISSTHTRVHMCTYSYVCVYVGRCHLHYLKIFCCHISA